MVRCMPPPSIDWRPRIEDARGLLVNSSAGGQVHRLPQAAAHLPTALLALACGSVASFPLTSPPIATQPPPTSGPPELPTATATPAGLALLGPYVLFAGQNTGAWVANP